MFFNWQKSLKINIYTDSKYVFCCYMFMEKFRNKGDYYQPISLQLNMGLILSLFWRLYTYLQR